MTETSASDQPLAQDFPSPRLRPSVMPVDCCCDRAVAVLRLRLVPRATETPSVVPCVSLSLTVSVAVRELPNVSDCAIPSATPDVWLCWLLRASDSLSASL